MSKLTDSYNNFTAALKSIHEKFPVKLRKPVSEGQLADLEKLTKVKYPDELKEFYAIGGGQKLTHDEMIFDFQFISTKGYETEILKEDEDVYAEEPDYYYCHPEGAIKPKRNHSKWLPIANRDMKDYHRELICIDMDPGPNGKEGQVISVFPEHNPRVHGAHRRLVLADSLSEFFDLLTARIKDEKFYFKKKDYKFKLSMEKKTSIVDTLFNELASDDLKAKVQEVHEKYLASSSKYINQTFGVEFQVPKGYIMSHESDSWAERKLTDGQYDYVDTKVGASTNLYLKKGEDQEATIGVFQVTSEASNDPMAQTDGLVALYEQQAAAYANMPGMEFKLDKRVKEGGYGFPAFMYLKQGMMGYETTTLYFIEPNTLLQIGANNFVTEDEFQEVVDSIRRL